jgi:hypothetical protein
MQLNYGVPCFGSHLQCLTVDVEWQAVAVNYTTNKGQPPAAAAAADILTHAPPAADDAAAATWLKYAEWTAMTQYNGAAQGTCRRL